jgi:hypothetical protein
MLSSGRWVAYLLAGGSRGVIVTLIGEKRGASLFVEGEELRL